MCFAVKTRWSTRCAPSSIWLTTSWASSASSMRPRYRRARRSPLAPTTCGRRPRASCARPSSGAASPTRLMKATAPFTGRKSTSRSKMPSAAGGNARPCRWTSTCPSASTSSTARRRTAPSVRGCCTVRSSAPSSASSASSSSTRRATCHCGSPPCRPRSSPLQIGTKSRRASCRRVCARRAAVWRSTAKTSPCE